MMLLLKCIYSSKLPLIIITIRGRFQDKVAEWSNEYVKCEFKTKSTQTKEGITGVFTNAPPCKCE